MSLIPIGGGGRADHRRGPAPVAGGARRVAGAVQSGDQPLKLLQIVLVGRLDLLDVLASPEVKQLNQPDHDARDAESAHRADVEAYIGHRLSVAHGSSSIGFDSAAIDAIHAASGGVRVINLLCDRSLMIAASFGLRAIPADIMSEATVALGLPTARAGARAWSDRVWRWAAVAATIVALIAGLLLFSALLSPF